MGDEAALEAALRRMLGAREARLEMGRRGREKAERLYNRDVHYDRIMGIYEDVLAHHRPR